MIYIKAPKGTAAYLGLLNSRSMLADGTYLLWDRDVMRLCGSGTVEELLPQIGCVSLSAAEVRAEQNNEGEPAALPRPTLTPLLDFMRENGYELPAAEESDREGGEE